MDLVDLFCLLARICYLNLSIGSTARHADVRRRNNPPIGLQLCRRAHAKMVNGPSLLPRMHRNQVGPTERANGHQ